MSELIDREATVKQICKMGEMVGGHDRDVVISIALFVQDDKTAFPTVERPHGEWIPVEERLPEDDKEVLVYVRRKDGDKSEMNGLHIARRHQMEGDPEGNNNFWGIPVAPCEWRIEGWSYFFEPEVLAWMPLPEPYKEEGDSDA